MRLLKTAEFVMGRSIPGLEGRWQVTAAALIRQSIERSARTGLEHLGFEDPHQGKLMFLLLRQGMDGDLVGQAHLAWGRLSDACHATSHRYPPTVAELQRWLGIAGEFESAVAALEAEGP